LDRVQSFPVPNWSARAELRAAANRPCVGPGERARANITLPDELLERARAAGLNVSRVSAAALSEALDRRTRIAALDS
jgi:post-segregation antitoxin (ccd killing protein)